MHATLRKGNEKIKKSLLQAKKDQNGNGHLIKQVKQHSHKPSKQKHQKQHQKTRKARLTQKSCEEYAEGSQIFLGMLELQYRM